LFPSADGALTALTSSFCIDILGLQQREGWTEQQKKRTRLTVHFSFTIVFLICILIFYKINDNSIIDIILDLAGYTYGPLLGLFAFGIFTKRSLPDHMGITALALLAPLFVEQTSSCSVQRIPDWHRTLAHQRTDYFCRFIFAFNH
jgi:Na+/proline symporter